LKSAHFKSASRAEITLLTTEGGTFSAWAAEANDFISTTRQKNLSDRSLSISSPFGTTATLFANLHLSNADSGIDPPDHL
jgi:hypothetical protein